MSTTSTRPHKQPKYVFRYDNHLHNTLEEYHRFIKWCGDLEIPIKYIGKSTRGRCKWLQIEVGVFLAQFITANYKELQLYKTIA